VPVAQFAEHVSENLEQLVLRQVVAHLHRVAAAYLVPVEPVLLALRLEEAVVLVHYAPQSLEVAARIVGILLLVNA